jgi:L-ascorbate metabolism protein UlaG (beta-lactamase superfamily)
MKRFVFFVFATGLAIIILNGCATPTANPTATPLPTTTPLPLPTVTATPDLPQVITLFYGNNAQFEITSPAGTRVLFDVIDPSKLSAPLTEKDILLTTHGHTDHYNAALVKSFPGQKITFAEGEINLPDVKIKSIVSGHNANDPLVPEKGTNYIFIVDMGGLRIAHFGDIGQDKLTDKQLEALGQVDIAITQFDNSFSNMNVTNEKGFNLMDQLKPKLIVPTAHISLPTITLAMKRWKGYVHIDPGSLKIGRSDLPAEPGILIFGTLATSYQKIFKLPAW